MRPHLWLLAALLTMTGCGTTATRPPRPAPPAPVAQPSSLPVAPPASSAEAHAAITRAVTAVRALPGFTLEMAWMQRAGSRVARGRYKVAGKAPRTTRIEIVEGSNVGTRVLYTGGTTARVRAGGLLGALPISLAITDERLKSLRGYTIRETDLTGLMAMLGHPDHQARLVPGPAGRIRVAVAGGPLLAGCTRLEAELDPTTQLPLAIHAYDPQTCVFTMEMCALRAAPNVSTDL